MTKNDVWQKCSRTQGSKKILREMDEGRLISLEFFFFLREEMMKWRRKIKVKKKVNSVNGGRKVEEAKAKIKIKMMLQAKSGGPNFGPHT